LCGEAENARNRCHDVAAAGFDYCWLANSIPAGGGLTGLCLITASRSGRCRPEQQQVAIGLRLSLSLGIQFSAVVRSCGALPDLVADLGEVERPMPLAAPADQRDFAHRVERCLDNFLPPLVYGRRFVLRPRSSGSFAAPDAGQPDGVSLWLGALINLVGAVECLSPFGS
jgi:hypothetical protein